jgi:hypothetical protein
MVWQDNCVVERKKNFNGNGYPKARRMGFFVDYSFWRTGKFNFCIIKLIYSTWNRDIVPISGEDLCPFIHSPWDSVAVRRRILVYWLRLVQFHSEWICLHSIQNITSYVSTILTFFLFQQVTLPNRTTNITCTSNGGTK